MAPNEQAQRNHDELFPNYLSKVAVTDPELIEIFDNFAFDEVLHHQAGYSHTLDGAVGGHHRLPGGTGVSGHARRSAQRKHSRFTRRLRTADKRSCRSKPQRR